MTKGFCYTCSAGNNCGETVEYHYDRHICYECFAEVSGNDFGNSKTKKKLFRMFHQKNSFSYGKCDCGYKGIRIHTLMCAPCYHVLCSIPEEEF